jgi:anti-anti-sigma factor
MLVHHESHDSMQVYRPVGRLDSATSGELEALLVEQLDGGCKGVVLDLADLDYISSAGLRVILMTGKRLRANGGRLVLARMRDSVRDLFDMSGFLGLFPLADSVEQALA